MISAIHDATNNNPSATGSGDANTSKRKRKRSSGPSVSSFSTSSSSLNCAGADGATTTPSSQACAVCKYQRRKCKPDCLLASFFPASDQERFVNAHRLFGVNNILKIVRDLDPPRRAQAMETIIYESNMRMLDPVGGCYGVICNLLHQIERYESELDKVKRQLAARRAQARTVAAVTTASAADFLDHDPMYDAANYFAFVDHGMISPLLQQQHDPQFVDYFVFGGEMPTDQSCISAEIPVRSINSEHQQPHINDQQTAAVPI